MNAAPDLIPFVLSGEVLTWDPVNRWLVRVSLGVGSRLPPSPRPEPVGAGHFEQCPERSGAGTQCPRLVVEQMEVPDQAKAAETEPVQASGGDLAVDRVNREEGDP
jgi:hypothetical protein